MEATVSLIFVFVILYFVIVQTNGIKFVISLKDGDILCLFGKEDKLNAGRVGFLLMNKYNKKTISFKLLEERLALLVNKGKLLARYEMEELSNISDPKKGQKIRVFFLPPVVFYK